MELNLCPTCGAFIRTTWESCHACGAVLGAPAAVAPVEEPAAEEYLVIDEEPLEISTDDEVAEAPEEAFEFQVEPEPQFEEPVEPVSESVEDQADEQFDAHELLAFPSEVPDFAAFAQANGTSNFSAPTETTVIEPESPEPFNGQEPTFTSFSYFSNDDIDPELASLAAGAPLSESAFTVASDNSRSISLSDWRERFLPKAGLPVVLSIAGAIVLLSALSFLSMFFLYKPAPDQPVTATPTTVDGAKWSNYSQPGAFSVDLPSQPIIDITPTHVLFQSMVPNTENRLEIYTAPVNPGRDKALDGQLMFNQLQATAVDRFTSVESSSFQTIGKQRRLSAHFANADKTINGDAQFFIENDMMYGLWLMSPDSTGDPVSFGRMVEGFKPE